MGNDYWGTEDDHEVHDKPLVVLSLNNKHFVTILFYNRDEALREARAFYENPHDWLDLHFYSCPNKDSDDDDDDVTDDGGFPRKRRPPFVPHWPCRVMPVVWEMPHHGLVN